MSHVTLENRASYDKLNGEVVDHKTSDHCVVSNIAECIENILQHYEEKHIPIDDYVLRELSDIFYYLDEGVEQYEQLAEHESEVERLKSVISDAIYDLEQA